MSETGYVGEGVKGRKFTSKFANGERYSGFKSRFSNLLGFPDSEMQKEAERYKGAKPKPYSGGALVHYHHQRRNLADRALAGASLVAIFGSLAYSLSTITGRAIGNLNTLDTNIIGTILFVLGVVGLLVSLKRR